ncbi:cytochrome P450 [Granulicoccus phenolivorans]|uniref:cytochrome P450 n=1 Tax=Granulicoccus phenolivorans TaxID=266854 RepID=UPI00040BDEC8|nr:cytochrome P450 [Granulicoccus phenolivorans]
MSDHGCPTIHLGEINSAHDAAAGYAKVRDASSGTVARGDDLGGYWAITGYDQVKQAATNTDQLISGKGCTIPRLGSAFTPIPVEVDPPMHRHYRRLLVPELRPEAAEKWAGRIAEVTDKVIDRFIESGEGDLREIANTVPPAIIASILGSPDDAKAMVSLTHDLNEAAMSGDLERKKAANMAVFGLTDRIVTEAENAGPDRDDLAVQIARGVVNGEPITHQKAVWTTVTLVVAGHETTVNGISSILWLVAAHPEIKQQLLDDPSLLDAAVEEALRLESPVQLMGRTATQDMDLFGVQIKEGDAVGLTWGAANTDPAKFENPSEFRLDRGNNPHVAFGHGIHRCVGEHLARVEMKVTLQRVLERMPDYELNGDVVIGANIDQNRGALTVPVKFTAGAKLYANA